VVKVRRFSFGSFSEPFSINDLSELTRLFPGEDILIAGRDGFKPITNRSHWGAAGYGPIENEDDPMWSEPAHFNPPFFEIIQDE
jgi:hypothetical protein